MIGCQMQHPRKGLSNAVGVLSLHSVCSSVCVVTGSDSMPLPPDESTLLSLQAPVCSVVFSALTDPSVQLQLVGIKALTVLGSLQGWCLVSLEETEGGVALF